jgi:hypothetical protein
VTCPRDRRHGSRHRPSGIIERQRQEKSGRAAHSSRRTTRGTTGRLTATLERIRCSGSIIRIEGRESRYSKSSANDRYSSSEEDASFLWHQFRQLSTFFAHHCRPSSLFIYLAVLRTFASALPSGEGAELPGDLALATLALQFRASR